MLQGAYPELMSIMLLCKGMKVVAMRVLGLRGIGELYVQNKGPHELLIVMWSHPVTLTIAISAISLAYGC